MTDNVFPYSFQKIPHRTMDSPQEKRRIAIVEVRRGKKVGTDRTRVTVASQAGFAPTASGFATS